MFKNTLFVGLGLPPPTAAASPPLLRSRWRFQLSIFAADVEVQRTPPPPGILDGDRADTTAKRSDDDRADLKGRRDAAVDRPAEVRFFW